MARPVYVRHYNVGRRVQIVVCHYRVIVICIEIRSHTYFSLWYNISSICCIYKANEILGQGDIKMTRGEIETELTGSRIMST